MAEYSVLMSVYAKENPEYLRESIESIWNQTVKTNDFWVVCDGPLTKELDAVLEENQKAHKEVFHLLRLKENVGLGRALNEGLKCCKNEAVARMDSDDIACKDRCEKQLRVLEEGIDIVSGTVVEFEKDILHCKAKRTLPLSKEEILKFAGRRNPFNHPCVMYRKEAVEKAGGYQHFYLFEDYYLWARMLLLGVEARNLPDTLLYMRAGTGMYKRRGGWKYVKSMLHFRLFLWKSVLSSFLDFVVCAGGQMMICLIPNRLRELFYKKFLRK